MLVGQELVYFGVKSFHGKKAARTFLPQAAESVTRVVRRYRPDILAIEEVYYAQARSSLLLTALIYSLRILGRKHRLRIERILPTEVKRYFCIGKPTRQSLAEAMCRRYCFLVNYLRPNRTRVYWQQMFDAVGLGAFVACQIREYEGIKSKPPTVHPQRSSVPKKTHSLRGVLSESHFFQTSNSHLNRMEFCFCPTNQVNSLFQSSRRRRYC